MEVRNALVPNTDQMQGFLNDETNLKVYMVNLLKFKQKAVYEDGRETNLTGQEAYANYAAEVVNHLKKVGGKIIFSGNIERLMLGEVGELWDTIAIAEYPNRKAMFDMITDVDYQKSEVHRSAGLKGQLNIETR